MSPCLHQLVHTLMCSVEGVQFCVSWLIVEVSWREYDAVRVHWREICMETCLCTVLKKYPFSVFCKLLILHTVLSRRLQVCNLVTSWNTYGREFDEHRLSVSLFVCVGLHPVPSLAVWGPNRTVFIHSQTGCGWWKITLCKINI